MSVKEWAMDNRPENRSERILSIIVAVLTAILIGVLVWAVFIDEDPAPPFDPISYEPQRIEAVDSLTGEVRVPTVPGFDGIPAVLLDGTVPVVGVRCVTGTDQVKATGSLVWERVDTPGTRVSVSTESPGVFDPGCTPLRFENQVPVRVREIVTESGRPQQWRIAGAVTPVAPNGVTATWETEYFWLVP